MLFGNSHYFGFFVFNFFIYCPFTISSSKSFIVILIFAINTISSAYATIRSPLDLTVLMIMFLRTYSSDRWRTFLPKAFVYFKLISFSFLCFHTCCRSFFVMCISQISFECILIFLSVSLSFFILIKWKGSLNWMFILYLCAVYSMCILFDLLFYVLCDLFLVPLCWNSLCYSTNLLFL